MRIGKAIRIGRTTDARLNPYDKASEEFNDALWSAIEKFESLKIAERLARKRLAKKLAKATVRIVKK